MVVLGQDGDFGATFRDTGVLCNDLVTDLRRVQDDTAGEKRVAGERGGGTSIDVEASEDGARRVAGRVSLRETDVTGWVAVQLLTAWY